MMLIVILMEKMRVVITMGVIPSIICVVVNRDHSKNNMFVKQPFSQELIALYNY